MANAGSLRQAWAVLACYCAKGERALREIEAILADQPKSRFTAELTDEQVQSFETRGFTSIARITTDEEVAWLREVYDWLFADKSRALKGLHFDLTRPYESEG